jgi:hypothetical protein
MKVMPERLLHGINMADKIRVGPDQLPELYGHLPSICASLGVAEGKVRIISARRADPGETRDYHETPH